MCASSSNCPWLEEVVLDFWWKVHGRVHITAADRAGGGGVRAALAGGGHSGLPGGARAPRRVRGRARRRQAPRGVLLLAFPCSHSVPHAYYWARKTE